MGYGSVAVGYVPRTTNYQDAKHLFDNTKPIRGRADNRKPLGRRKDVDGYWIRENNDNGVAMVEFMCYRTEVVTYFEDGRIRIKTDGWATPTTHAFIYYALGIQCNGADRKTNININGGTYQLDLINGHTMWVKEIGENYKKIVLDTDRWKEPTKYNYRMSRKKANEVRKKYSKFTDYLNGFLSLRGDGGVVQFEHRELVEIFGTAENQWGGAHVLNEDFRHCMRRATETRWGDRETYHAKYLAAGTRIVGLMTSTDHTDFYRAAMTFIAGERTYMSRNDSWNSTAKTTVEKVKRDVNDFILRWHAEDVLEKYEVEAGTLPTGKYRHWL